MQRLHSWQLYIALSKLITTLNKSHQVQLYILTLNFSISVTALPGASSCTSYVYGADINDPVCISWSRRASLSLSSSAIHQNSSLWLHHMPETQPYLEMLTARPSSWPGDAQWCRLCEQGTADEAVAPVCERHRRLLQTHPSCFPLRFSFLLLSRQGVYEQ